MALTEEHGMEKNFEKLNCEFRIGTRPNEKCMTLLTELKSPNSVTEQNANTCAIDAKYSEISCTEVRQQPLEGNAQEKARGEAIQETDLLGDNPENVDADLQREPIRLKHKRNTVFELSGTSVSVANEEGPSVPMTCKATGVSAPLQEPAKDIAALILPIFPRGPGNETPYAYERCRDPDPQDTC